MNEELEAMQSLLDTYHTRYRCFSVFASATGFIVLIGGPENARGEAETLAEATKKALSQIPERK